MFYTKQLPALFLLFVLSACSNGIEEGNTIAPAKTNTTPNNTISTQPVQQQTTAPAANDVALNPAHGQPGHRCDINVGAPLNSKPNQPTINPAQQQTIINPTPAPAPAPSTVPSGKQAGINPAHGLPGHRCDIAVGAPLNSKPTQ